MLNRVAYLWRHDRLAVVAFSAALALTLFFAVRMLVFSIYWSDPTHRAQPPEPWMTPRYIAHSWGLDPAEVALALGAVKTPGPRPTLREIARLRNVPLQQVLVEAQALLDATRATK
jgi:hypothetical protein